MLDASSGAPLEGAAVYLWHCDRDGGYSLYSDGVTDQNYLRGVQAAGSDGTLRFTSIFPGAYPGVGPTCTSRCSRASTLQRGKRSARHIAAGAAPGHVRHRLRHDGYERA